MIKRLIACTLLLMIAMSSTVFAASPRQSFRVESYIYNRVGADADAVIATHSPLPYRFYRSVTARDMGVPALSNINDMFYHDGQFYIAHANQLIITDMDLVAHTILEGVYENGTFHPFTHIEGIFITRTGEVYLTQPFDARLVHLDKDLNLVRFLGHPEGLLIPAGLSYQPQQVAVDQNGRIYVISGNVLEGLVEINPDGTFNRFFGVINVTFTATELFWRNLQTTAQRARVQLWLPTTFTNLTIDRHGFIYATISDGDLGESVRKLNARGANILRRPDYGTPSIGDLNFNLFGFGLPVGPSMMSQVEVTDFGVYYVFDRTRNRIFAYDTDGHLLFAFGGRGEREGLTQNVVGMTLAENMILLADRANNSIEIFERTQYGIYVLEAARYQYNADYRTAADYWRRVLEMNPYFQYANLGVGRALYRSGNFLEAQEYFRRAQNVQYFSRAFQQTRSEMLARNFTAIGVGIGVIIALIIFRSIYKKIRPFRRLKRGAIL